jgi:DNA polymerase-3 subunit epsilon
MRQIVLDTETTGLSPKEGHRIIEVGCLELVDRRLTNNNLHFYINPERDIDRGAAEVHGITSEFLADKPVFKGIAEELFSFLKGAELIIHNAPFDMGFLNNEFKLLGHGHQSLSDACDVIDSLVIARRKHPGQKNSLDALCRRYSIDNSNRDLHGALLDSELLAQVYLLMTGGQGQLFAGANSESTAVEEKSALRRLDASRQPLPIIEPNNEEILNHQAFIGMLKEKGECVWETED